MRASEDERQLSLDRSSQLNDAYRTLRDPVARVEYLLSLAGMRKEGQKKQQAPPELLEEVFELNESLDELREARASGGNAAQMAGLRAKLESAQHKFESSLADVDQELAQRLGRMGRRARFRRRRSRKEKTHGADERSPEPPFVHSESGERSAAGISRNVTRDP